MRQLTINEHRLSSDAEPGSTKERAVTDIEHPPSTEPLYSGPDLALIELSRALKDPKKRKALRELRGERAQSMIDFLHTVSTVVSLHYPPSQASAFPVIQLLLQPERGTPRLLATTVITLYKLAKEANLYPQCYVIKDVTVIPDEGGLALPREGGRTGDIFKAVHKGHHICLKVMRLFRKADLEAALKVCFPGFFVPSPHSYCTVRCLPKKQYYGASFATPTSSPFLVFTTSMKAATEFV